MLTNHSAVGRGVTENCPSLVQLLTNVHKHNYLDHVGEAWLKCDFTFICTSVLDKTRPSSQLQKSPQEDAQCKQKSNNTNQEATQ